MIGSDFRSVANPYTRKCSECGRVVRKGEPILASVRAGRAQKYVCSEDCRQEFDFKFWANVADKRETERG